MSKTGYSRMATVLCAISAVIWSGGHVARADFLYGAPTGVPNINSDAREESQPQISRDGLELYFLSDRVDSTGGGYNIWVSRRTRVRGPWSAPIKLPSPVNTAGPETSPSLSGDGLELYFSEGIVSNASADLWVSTRASREAPWDQPVNLLTPVNSEKGEDCPCISADGLSLYFISSRPGVSTNPGNTDVFVTTRPSRGVPWGEPVNLGPNVNTNFYEYTPFLSPDGLSLYFSRGFQKAHVYVCKRRTTADPWGPAEFFAPVNSGTAVYSGQAGAAEWNLSFAYGDSKLYFGHATDLFSNDKDIWQVEVTPVLDFNGDGKVDEKDFLVMAQHWDQAYSRCDIGPRPVGDGVVDAQDLIVFLETTEGRDVALSPRPHATQVARDAILTWTSPAFAKTHDVYFGTSFIDVNAASRSNPQGVLVSQSQTATTYDPNVLLGPGRTYYWRIDEIGGAPDFTIYRGPVLDFQTQAIAFPITPVAAVASSAQPSMGPGKTIDGSGLIGDQHGTENTTMWLSAGVQPNWIQYQFDKVHQFHELWVWNSNQSIESLLGFGAKDVKIEWSSDGTTWTQLQGVPPFARAPGIPGYVANTIVSFGDVPATHVKLTLNSTWGGMSIAGLSEVRFFCLPE